MIILAAVSVFLYMALLLSILRSETQMLQDQDNERFFTSTISNLDSNVRECNALIENFNENNMIMLNNLAISMSGTKFHDLESLNPEDQSDLLLNADGLTRRSVDFDCNDQHTVTP